MKPVAELLAEARKNADAARDGDRFDICNSLDALCDAIEQMQQRMAGCRMVVDAHNEHAVRTIDDAAIRKDERERIATAIETGAAFTNVAPAEWRYAIAKRIRESAP